ncbi:MAG: DegT/DnrJ/EryC1/StrS family aminotransferase [Promethearchaeota archaeon]
MQIWHCRKTLSGDTAMIPFGKPIVTESQKEAALKVLSTTSFILGENVQKFEEEFATYCGAKYGIGVSSGTEALYLALLAVDITRGDEVITVPNTFIATSNAIIHAGATPVFVEIDPITYTIDTAKLKEKISNKTRAIIPVHLYGHPANMDPIVELAEQHDLLVIEDACQAHGGKYKGKPIGSLSDIACFSFYPSKNMTVCGDGGMVVTDNEEYTEKIQMLRSHGQRVKNRHDLVGFTARLSELSAAIGREQLKELDNWNRKRRENATLYNDLLEDCVITPIEREWAYHVYHLYVVQTEKRDALVNFLTKNEIGVGIHYPTPIHLQPAYTELFHFSSGMYPISEETAKKILSLPVHPALSQEDVHFVAEKVIKFCR